MSSSIARIPLAAATSMLHHTTAFLLSVLVLAGFCVDAMATVALKQQCPLSYSLDPYPGYVVAMSANYGGYSEQQLVTPEPIPLRVLVTDTDTLLIYCEEICMPVSIPGAPWVDWSTEASGSENPGAFITAMGSLVDELEKTFEVLYLPPRDLGLGEERTVWVHADITDGDSHTVLSGPPTAGGSAVDPATRASFRVTIERDANEDDYGNHRFAVSVMLVPAPPLKLDPPECRGSSENCELLRDGGALNRPSLAWADVPSAGMILGEVRPISVEVSNTSEVWMECGTPPGHRPFESTFGAISFAETPLVSWMVLAGPGNGTFLTWGSTTFFFSSAEGLVTIEASVQGPSGEVKIQTTFEIFLPKLKSLKYANHLPLVQDSGELYGPVPVWPFDTPHWLDDDDDGDATNQTGDRRISVAYERETRVNMERLVIDCRTPAPPYAILRGKDPDRREFLTALTRDDPLLQQSPNHLSASSFKANNNLGNTTGLSRFFMQLEWPR